MILLRAPAKLNLSLRVIGKRADGYHEIETLFERIDLADELTIEPQERDLFLTCSHPTLSSGEDNLVLKAARLLQHTTATASGARFHLLKRIPIAAGLGGGSSDAAAALVGLNELWGLALGRPRLVELAAQLGSDVPFFLAEAPFAIGRGRGERCEPVPATLVLFAVLAVPDARLSTKEIYEALDRREKQESTLTASAASITILAHALRNGPAMAGLAQGVGNDLEPEAIRRCPVIATIQSRLRECGCLGVGLSGSGPAVFGLCGDEPHARRVAEQLRAQAPPSWRIEVVHTDPTSMSPRYSSTIRHEARAAS